MTEYLEVAAGVRMRADDRLSWDRHVEMVESGDVPDMVWG